MKSVLIDLTQVPRKRMGVGVYALNYVRHLHEVSLGTDLRLHFLVQDDDKEMLACALAVPGAVVHRIPARLFRRFLLRVVLEQVIIPLLALRHSIDVVHSLHYSFPLVSFGRFKRVVTVCDMTFFLFPEMHVPIKRLFFRFFIRRLPQADGLLYISSSTRQDFARMFPRSRAAECVIPLGADLARLACQPEDTAVDAVRRRLGTDRFVLYIGTIEPRKNIGGLVRAFERIADRHPGLKLVIAGKPGWGYDDLMKYIEASRLRARIVLTGYVDETEKHALLKAALVFVYVSFYEGFGLPVLESMAAGVPTVTSNVSSLPEIAGAGALQVDPHDIVQIADAIETLLGDAQSRTAVAGRGLLQSKMFTWQSMTAKSVDFYQRLLAGV